MRYGIIVNPAAGRLGVEDRRRLIKRAADRLGKDTLVTGWDTRSPRELCDCARDLAAGSRIDVLVVAGGDGTFSDVVNAMDPGVVLSYIPLGSGNAWRSTLGLPRSLGRILQHIAEGGTHTIDLVLCNERRKGVFASVGIEGDVVKTRDRLIRNGTTGFLAYTMATAKHIIADYHRRSMVLTMNGDTMEVEGTSSVIVSKTPYYGYNFKVVPKASLDDGNLHVLTVETTRLGVVYAIVTSFLGGNRIGDYRSAKEVRVTSREEVYLQVDGNLDAKGRDFHFRVLPAALTLKS